MAETSLISGSYSVGYAERREIDSGWSNLKWDKDHFQIQYHRLYYPRRGRARLRLFNRELELVPDKVYFLPAFSIAESYIDGTMDKYFIHFQVDSPFLDMYRYISDKYSSPAGPHTDYLFDTVVNNYTDKSLAARLKVQGALNLIMADFIGDVPAKRSSIAKFEQVLRYINEHYTEQISLGTLSDIMNISTMYFSNFFKRVFNISPKQYILNKRLTESQRLLLETKLSVKEIAYTVGFENENYFSEYFSSKVGVSALRFRNRDFRGCIIE